MDTRLLPRHLANYAQSMLVCLCLFAGFAHGQDFGKLFTTPEERRYLDGLREKFLQRTELEGFNINEQFRPLLESAEPTQNVEFQLSGFMRRKNGGTAVWLNGNAVDERDLPQNVQLVSRKGQNMLRISTEEKVHFIRAGQTLNVETGSIRESFEPRPEGNSLDDIASSITGLFQPDKETAETTAEKSSGGGSVGIDDLIDALKVIQETKGE